jgi:CelD/BcsL family acetyltransferase involved in cellulose biosynthesis
MTPGERVERVTSLDRLRELEPTLQDLFQRDLRATPFQSPDWLLSWVECFVADATLCWLMVYAGERAVAALPLMIAQRGGQRRLHWVGEGISDRLDALVDPRADARALGQLRRALGELCSEVDRIELDELPEERPGHGLWVGLDGTRLEPGSVCPVLRLDGVNAQGERVLPDWLRRNLGQTERRLSALGRREWRSAGVSDGPERLETFMSLHTARWRARGQPGVLADPAVQAFHRAVAPRLLARGLLELDLLYLDDRPLAATYVLRRSDSHLYLFGFDPALPRLSLGSLAVWRSIRRAASGGCRYYDFLRGCEPYKYAFGALNRQSFRCIGARAAWKRCTDAANAPQCRQP